MCQTAGRGHISDQREPSCKELHVKSQGKHAYNKKPVLLINCHYSREVSLVLS